MALAYAEDESIEARRHSGRRLPPRPMSSGTVVEIGIESLRPTQMAVGMRAVTFKRRRLESRAENRKKIEKLLARRPIPAVRGPGGDLFIIDNHHFGLALWQAEVETAFARIVADLTRLSPQAFWRRMEADGRLYPYDEDGCRVSVSRLPTWLHALRHDTYRDLAWSVREAGGFRKVRVPYTEFRWANHFRERISLRAIRTDYDACVERALKFARTKDARHLPGWIGAR